MSRFVTLSLAFESDLSAARRAYEDFAREVEGRKLKVQIDASAGARAGATTFSGQTGVAQGAEFAAGSPISPTPKAPGTPPTPANFSGGGATLSAAFVSSENDPTGLLAQSAGMRQQLASLQQRIAEMRGGAATTGTGGVAAAAGVAEPMKLNVDTTQAKNALAEIRQIATETRGVLANAIVPYGQMARGGTGGGMGGMASPQNAEDVIEGEWRYAPMQLPGPSMSGGGDGVPPGGGLSLGAMNDAHVNRWRMSMLPESSGARDFSAPSRNPFAFATRSFMSNRAAFLTIAGMREIMGATSAVARGTQAEATGASLEDQFTAQMQGIDQVQSGMLGPIAGFLVDPNGSRRASLNAMANAGQATNAGSASMRTWGEYRLRLSEQAQVSRFSATDPDRESAMADMNASQMRRQAIQERNVRVEAAIAQIRAGSASEVSQMDSRDPRILALLQPGDLGSLSTRMAAAREGLIDQMTNKQSQQMFGTLNTQMEGAISSVDAIHASQIRDINLQRALQERGATAANIAQSGAFDVAQFGLRGQTEEGQIAASFANQRATQLQNTPFSVKWWQTAATAAQDRDIIARNDRLRQMGVESDTRVADLLANRDEYGAAQQRLSDAFSAETLGMDTSTDDYQRLQRRFQSQQRANETERLDQLNTMNLGLVGEQAGLQKRLSRDYAGAQLENLTTGYDVRQSSLMAPDEQDARIQTLQNEKLAVLGFRQDYFDSFRGESLDLRRFDVTNPRDQEDPNAFNQEVLQKLDDINTTLTNLGVDAN